MGRRLVTAQLLLHPPKDCCGVTAITTAQRIQPITPAGKELQHKYTINIKQVQYEKGVWYDVRNV